MAASGISGAPAANLDVSADISVLHAMLAQEGLTEGPFDVKP